MSTLTNMLFIFNRRHVFVENKQQCLPASKSYTPSINKFLSKWARKRRKLTTTQVAERANIDRSTLYHVEKGNSSVSIGAYFNVLRALGLEKDFLKLAADDAFGRKLQDLELL